MEDFTFYFSYLDELEKFNYDVELYTFNDYKIDKFGEYRTHLNKLQKEFEKKIDAIIINDSYPTDKLIRNFGVLNIKFDKIYEHVRREYTKFVNQYKYWQLPKSKEHDSRKIPSGRFTNNSDLKMLDAIIGFHVSIMNLTKDCINSRLALVAIAESSNLKTLPVEIPIINNTKEKAAEEKADILLANNSNKILLNLSKKEIALSFILFTQMEYIKFDNSKQLYDFIQDNFRYLDKTGGKIKISDIKNINTEFSRLTLDVNGKGVDNKKYSKKFINRYTEKIDIYLSKLSDIKLPPFRAKL